MVCDPATVMVCPLLHWTTYDAGALPLGASHARVTVQSVTPVTRRFFGADADCGQMLHVESAKSGKPKQDGDDARRVQGAFSHGHGEEARVSETERGHGRTSLSQGA